MPVLNYDYLLFKHDGTLQSLMYAMGIANDQQIPYAAAVIMEIWQREDGQFYTEVHPTNLSQ